MKPGNQTKVQVLISGENRKMSNVETASLSMQFFILQTE